MCPRYALKQWEVSKGSDVIPALVPHNGILVTVLMVRGTWCESPLVDYYTVLGNETRAFVDFVFGGKTCI